MTITDKARWNGFIVTPNDHVDILEATENGHDTDSFVVTPGLFAALEAAGYPLSRERYAGHGRFFDLGVDPTDPTDVIAYTVGDQPREHMLGEKAAVFLRWYRENVAEGSNE